jgi:hypothetical protein
MLTLLFMMSSLASATNKNAGTSGAQFLKIGAGARPTAMGEAFVGVADDVNAVSYNPAGLGFLDKTEFSAMHTQYFQGLDYDFGAYAQPLKHGTLALSAATLKTDDITRRALDETNTGSFKNQDASYALAYAHRLGATLSAGVTARLIREEIDSASAQAWSADVGVLKKFSRRPVSVGFAVRNLGQPIGFNDESDPLPLAFDAGMGIDLLRNRLKIAADLRHVRDTGVQAGIGSEWRETLRGNFRYAARAGYDTADADVEGASGLSLGAGIGYKLFDLDFAWVPFGILGNTFRYSAHLKF